LPIEMDSRTNKRSENATQKNKDWGTRRWNYFIQNTQLMILAVLHMFKIRLISRNIRNRLWHIQSITVKHLWMETVISVSFCIWRMPSSLRIHIAAFSIQRFVPHGRVWHVACTGNTCCYSKHPSMPMPCNSYAMLY
jgi:hypothetical protein